MTAIEPGVSPTQVELERFDSVIVRKFADGVSHKNRSTRGVKRLEMSKAGDRFADEVAAAIVRSAAFTSVERRGRADASTLVINGRITAFKRRGMFARIPVVRDVIPTDRDTAFVATVMCRDGASGAVLATFEVDQASWIPALPADHPAIGDIMYGPAEHVANELFVAKRGDEAHESSLASVPVSEHTR